MTQGFARSASFDSLATKFLAAAVDAKSAVMDEVTSAGGSLVDDAKTNAELYGRYMKKAVEKVGGTCACWLFQQTGKHDSHDTRQIQCSSGSRSIVCDTGSVAPGFGLLPEGVRAAGAHHRQRRGQSLQAGRGRAQAVGAVRLHPLAQRGQQGVRRGRQEGVLPPGTADSCGSADECLGVACSSMSNDELDQYPSDLCIRWARRRLGQ